MKHITLFEGWEQTEMDFKMTPEKFGKEVDKSLEMDTESAIAHLADILRSNPELKSDRGITPHMKRFHQKFGSQLSGDPYAAPAASEMSLEDFKALVKGINGLPNGASKEHAFVFLNKIINEDPRIKKAKTEYMKWKKEI